MKVLFKWRTAKFRPSHLPTMLQLTTLMIKRLKRTFGAAALIIIFFALFIFLHFIVTIPVKFYKTLKFFILPLLHEATIHCLKSHESSHIHFPIILIFSNIIGVNRFVHGILNSNIQCLWLSQHKDSSMNLTLYGKSMWNLE